MSQTLKDNYQHKKLQKLKSKLRIAENTFISNNEYIKTSLLIEALELNVEEISEIVKKLRKFEDIINSDKAKNVDAAKKTLTTKIIRKNIEDVNEALSKEDEDEEEKGFLGKIKSLISSKKPKENPLIKTLAFISTLEEGFKALPAIVKNNIKVEETQDDKIEEQTINQLLNVDGLEDQTKKAEYLKAKQIITASFKKAFVTKGSLAGITDEAEIEQFYTGLMDLTLSTLNSLKEAVAAGPQASKTGVDAAKASQTGDVDQSKKASIQGELTPQQQKAQIIAVQAAAKDAGISEEETVTRFLSKIMGWDDGIKNPNSDIAINVLKDFAYNRAKVTKGQLDGFVDGLAINQEEVKTKIQQLVDKKAEEAAAKRKKGRTKKPSGAQNNLQPNAPGSAGAVN